MGYNTTVLILNDAFGILEDNPDQFFQKVRENWNAPTRPSPEDGIGETAESFGVSNHGNPAAVMTCTHADNTSLILVGGNYATVLGQTYGHEHHKRDTVKRMLNDILKQYDLQVIERKK